MMLMALALAAAPMEGDATDAMVKAWRDCTLNTAVDMARRTSLPPETIADAALGSCVDQQLVLDQWRWSNSSDRLAANSDIELDIANRRRALILAAILVRQPKGAAK